jgi:hypothetical protein
MTVGPPQDFDEKVAAETLMKKWRRMGFIAFCNRCTSEHRKPPGCSWHTDFTVWIEYGKKDMWLQLTQEIVG